MLLLVPLPRGKATTTNPVDSHPSQPRQKRPAEQLRRTPSPWPRQPFFTCAALLGPNPGQRAAALQLACVPAFTSSLSFQLATAEEACSIYAGDVEAGTKIHHRCGCWFEGISFIFFLKRFLKELKTG